MFTSYNNIIVIQRDINECKHMKHKDCVLISTKSDTYKVYNIIIN